WTSMASEKSVCRMNRMCTSAPASVVSAESTA
ncbi:MAG: hypothetical protein ACI9OJ_001151, partial [Myxococcota bacterium]